MQVALYLYGRSVALQAAREGVSQLRLYQTPAACDAAHNAVRDATKAYARTVGSGALNNVDAHPNCRPKADGSASVTVEVTGVPITLTPFSLPAIHQTVRGRVEKFQTEE